MEACLEVISEDQPLVAGAIWLHLHGRGYHKKYLSISLTLNSVVAMREVSGMIAVRSSNKLQSSPQ